MCVCVFIYVFYCFQLNLICLSGWENLESLARVKGWGGVDQEGKKWQLTVTLHCRGILTLWTNK